jgi:hypothetical protein
MPMTSASTAIGPVSAAVTARGIRGRPQTGGS